MAMVKKTLLPIIRLLRRKFTSLQLMVIVSPGGHAVFLSELSRCVQQDCTCDEGDAVVYYIEA